MLVGARLLHEEGVLTKGQVLGCQGPVNHERITSGLRETFIKRYTVERTSKAEIKLEEQSHKTESCQENLWNEIQLKGP